LKGNFFSGVSNDHGMVISLEIKETQWVIADLNQYYF